MGVGQYRFRFSLDRARLPEGKSYFFVKNCSRQRHSKNLKMQFAPLSSKTPQRRTAGASGKRVKPMYTEYGYSVDGIEYATVDEAEEADREAEQADTETSE